MKKLNKRCIICGAGDYPADPPVKRYYFKDRPFDVCDECVGLKVCPQCWGRGEIAIKRGSKPLKIELCDMCYGSGIIEYKKSKPPNLEDYKMIKVPAWVYDNLKQAKLAIERKKLSIKSDFTSPNKCPRCKKPMETFKARFEYNRCLNCGYTQQKIDLSATGNIALGIIVGLSAAALWQYLSGIEERR